MTTLKSVLPFFQIALSVALIAAILLQQRSGGLSATFGGDGNVYRTKRGLEKTLGRLTVIMVILLAASAIIAITLP